MSNSSFGVIAFCTLLGVVGALVAFYPRGIPRITNAYYALIRMRSRLAEEDYDRMGVRVAGLVLFALAVYVLIDRWSQLWK